MEVSKNPFLVRLTQVYQYAPDNVQLGAVFVHHQAGAHRIVLLTSQNKLNFEPRPGQQWEVAREDNYGIRQQEVSSGCFVDVWRFMNPYLKCVMPDNGSGFISFLSTEKSFKGIGKIKAQMLWDKFRGGLFSMLECEKTTPYKNDDYETNFDAIKDVLRANVSVDSLYDGFKDYANLKHASQLVEWEVEVPTQKQLFRMAGHDAIDFLNKNPYRLFSLGMRFEKVDDIAQKHFTINPDNPLRLAAIVEQALRFWSDKGNTVADWHDIEPSIRELLNNDQKLIDTSKELPGDLIGFVKEDGKYFISGNYIFEKTIAKRFSKLGKKNFNWLSGIEKAFNESVPDGWQLEKAQEASVRSALLSSMFVMTGGAGTGKTTTTKIIVDAFTRMGKNIYPVALSGKAARRLQQSIGVKAYTIAKLLSNKNIDTYESILLVDEASMLDSFTMWRLVTKFPASTRIILVGDPYQLPPINAGLILSDAIKAGVINHKELNVVKRQGECSSIPAYSNSIRNGEMPELLTTNDIIFQQSSGDMARDVIKAYSQYEKAMVVASTNIRVRDINVELQKSINPDGLALDLTDMPITKGSYDFRKGDPIVITLTCYKNDVQNGMLGILIDVEPTEEHACIVELEEMDQEGNKRLLKVEWRLFEYIDLAYCLTLHKLLGSQAENVIVLVERGILLDRSWLYTAVTRAESKVHIIGKESDFTYGVSKKAALDTRKTGLAEMLKNG
jgi:exodeoxyribonuclease V alpha subunit